MGGSGPSFSGTVFSTLWKMFFMQGLKDDILETCPGCMAATVASYCPTRPTQFEHITSIKLCKRMDEKR